MLQLAARGVGGGDEVGGRLVTQNFECIFVPVLPDVAVGGEVAGGGGAVEEVRAGDEGEGVGVVGGGEVGLRQREEVVVRVWQRSVWEMHVTGESNLTGQGEQLVADEDGRVMLLSVARVPHPSPQIPFHPSDSAASAGTDWWTQAKMLDAFVVPVSCK